MGAKGSDEYTVTRAAVRDLFAVRERHSVRWRPVGCPKCFGKYCSINPPKPRFKCRTCGCEFNRPVKYMNRYVRAVIARKFKRTIHRTTMAVMVARRQVASKIRMPCPVCPLTGRRGVRTKFKVRVCPLCGGEKYIPETMRDAFRRSMEGEIDED